MDHGPWVMSYGQNVFVSKTLQFRSQSVVNNHVWMNNKNFFASHTHTHTKNLVIKMKNLSTKTNNLFHELMKSEQLLVWISQMGHFTFTINGNLKIFGLTVLVLWCDMDSTFLSIFIISSALTHQRKNVPSKEWNNIGPEYGILLLL